MKKTYCLFLGALIAVQLVGLSGVVTQEPETYAVTQSSDSDDKEVDLDSYADVVGIKRLRERVIEQCTRILDRRATDDRPSKELDFRASMAAELLGELGARDAASIEALCRNLTLDAPVRYLRESGFPAEERLGEHPGLRISESINLSGSPRSLLFRSYVVVQALRRIGGPEVAQGIFQTMKRPLSRKELVLCALSLGFVEKYSDERLVALERVRIALSKQPDNGPEGKLLRKNLETLKEWLSDPEFKILNPRYTPDPFSDY